MYEKLTTFLPMLDLEKFGEILVDKENDGSPEHPIHWPVIIFDEKVNAFVSAVYDFMDTHEDMGLNHYDIILNEHGLAWDDEVMEKADVSALDGSVVMALIMGAIRMERFCDGALLDFFERGCIQKWLQRLKQIDIESAGRDFIRIVITSCSGYTIAEDAYGAQQSDKTVSPVYPCRCRSMQW